MGGQRGQLLLFSLSLGPVLFLLLPARPVCPTMSDLDNTLVERPKISCEESRIKMSIRTERPFTGNVYAKGFFHKDVCRVQGNGSGHVANITIPVNVECGMRRRRRSAGPHGLSLEIDVILMFHKKFLTKNDRAFHVECQYVEMDQRVGNRLDISALPSTELSQVLDHSLTMPKCRYEVLSTETGHPISFAAIGQSIMHKWTCQGAAAKEGGGEGDGGGSGGGGMYCLTVHSCEVDDGQGSVQKLLDDKGCPLEKGLFGAVDYKSDLEAVQRGNAFKFADRPTIYFSCQLRLELKSVWKECKRSVDSCAAAAGGAGETAIGLVAPTMAPEPAGGGGGAYSTPESAPESEETSAGGGGEEEEFGTGGFASSPQFPTPSPTVSSGFSMSTGTTGYPATRIQQIEEGGEEEKPPPRGKGGGGGTNGRAPSKQKGKGGGGKAEEEEMEEKGGEGVYVERPTLSIIRKMKRTTRASSTTTAASASSSRHPPASTASPKLASKGRGGGGGEPSYSSSGCHPTEFGLNSDCAFDTAPDAFGTSKEEDDRRHKAGESGEDGGGQRLPGRLSLKQRSTTPLEEMERMHRMSSSSSSGAANSALLNIDVSQAVDVLDVVAQSDAAAHEGRGDKSCRQAHHRRTSRPQAEPAEPFEQLCISRQLLSSALFLAILCILSILTIFVCCLISCQYRLRLRRGRPKPLASAATAIGGIGGRRRARVPPAFGDATVLDAYNP